MLFGDAFTVLDTPPTNTTTNNNWKLSNTNRY